MLDIPASASRLSTEEQARRAELVGHRSCRPRRPRRLWVGSVATWPGAHAYPHLGAPELHDPS